MGCQAMVFLGVVVRSKQDVEDAVSDDFPGKQAFVDLLRSSDDPSGGVGGDDDYPPGPDNVFLDTGITLTRQGAAHVVEMRVYATVHSDDEMNIGLRADPPGTVFGVALNSRYRPGFVDCDHEDGEGDLLPVSLDELVTHRDAIRKVIPRADLVVVHEWF